MAARPVWRGQIRFALVSIPVEIYPATKGGATIAFHQVHEPTGKRIRYQKVVPGIGPVDKDKIVKGYEVAKGQYVLLEPEEVEKVKLASRKTLELTRFVDADDIDPIYYDHPYYVIPADDLAEEAFIVLREALKESNKVGLGQLAMRGQEYLVALQPCGRGMLLETLRYADEVYKPASYFRKIGDEKPERDLLEMAETLIEKKSGDFNVAEFHNRYIYALKNLIEEKRRRKGELVIQDTEEAPLRGTNVIDLMAALKKSLGEEKPQPEAKPTVTTSAAKPPPRRTAANKAPARKTASGKGA